MSVRRRLIRQRMARAERLKAGGQAFDRGLREGIAAVRRIAESDWQPFTGDYEKQFYEVLLKGEGKILSHMYPNAGQFCAVDGSGKMIDERQVEFIRKCRCGHKWGGCRPEAEA